jgi:hypothetical protein
LIGIESVVSTKQRPRARNIPANVTMKGGIWKTWIRKPMPAPNDAARPRMSMKARYGLSPYRSMVTARNTPVKAMTDPTDRSMPPDRITKVMPTATMPRKALSVRRLPITRVEAKLGNWARQIR